MKKIFILCMIAMFSMSSMAQSNPNRLLVQQKNGSIKGFLVERIDSMYLAVLNGRVAADVTFKSFNTGSTGDTVYIAVQRTPECRYYRLACVTEAISNAISTEGAVERYFDQTNAVSAQEDFTNAAMTGFNFAFAKDAPYVIITLGYDKYGIPCSVSRASFRTPGIPLVGNPSVTGEVNEIETNKFTITFTPNSDCKGYAFCSFNKGTAEQEFNKWAAMMGFTSMGDMIKGFCGNEYSTVFTNTWTGQTPGTEYEVYVQPWDANGTYGEMVIIPVTTKSMGGEGLAEMTITIGEFGGSAATGYYQKVTYTPNDQTAFHRDIIITTDGYNTMGGENGVIDFLKADSPDPYWNQYGEDVATWNATPSTSYYACTIAQNAKGEWGPFLSVPFTTPSSPAGTKQPTNAIAKRMTTAKTGVTFGSVNDKWSMKKKTGITLTEVQ